MPRDDLWQLLDDRRLTGTHAVVRRLGPDRHVAVVADLDQATATISEFCELWGGACHLLFPFAADQHVLPPPWRGLLEEADADALWTNDLSVGDANSLQHRGISTVSSARGEPFVGIVAGQDRGRDEWAPVRLLKLDESDPWHVSYLATFGTWPPAPEAAVLQMNGYRDDLTYDDLVPVECVEVQEPGLHDLLSHLRAPNLTYPTMLSLLHLGVSSAPREADIPSQPILPWRRRRAAQIGPNIVVVYEPGSVADLCLLWDLRAAAGIPRYWLPLGIPSTTDIAAALTTIVDEYVFKAWGLGERRIAITSFSVPADRRGEIAAQAGPLWESVEPDELLQAARRPARVSTEVASFDEGRATVARWVAADRDAVGWGDGFHDLHVNVSLHRHPLPPSPTLEFDNFSSRFRDGGFEAQAQRPGETLEVHWPSGWTVLRALAHDRGLRAEPSAAGKAAAALLTQLGSVDAVQPLLDQQVIALLNHLCESRGIGWFRDRVRTLAAEVAGVEDDVKLDRIEEHLRSLIVAPEELDQRVATFSDFQRTFGRRDIAELWLEWAEQIGLLVRGGEVVCVRCGARSWRAVTELAPPVICRGCARVIDRPFRPDHLTFRYRASETLIRTSMHDGLSHLLALRWFTRILDGHMGEPGLVYGAYPGVEFRRDGVLVGEADVVLVLRTGDLVVGECKRSGEGLNNLELAKLEGVAAAARAPWSFVATAGMPESCPPIWQDAERALPEAPRFSLSGEHLLEPFPVSLVGANAFAWREPTPDDERKEAREAWLNHLPHVVEYLLGRRGYEEDLFERAVT